MMGLGSDGFDDTHLASTLYMVHLYPLLAMIFFFGFWHTEQGRTERQERNDSDDLHRLNLSLPWLEVILFMCA